ncbi:MAG: hypothetical protein V4663_00550 [Bacteroidota bacterium]
MDKINSRIVLITSGQPSLNPRLVKEADTLSAHGYEVEVLYQYWNAWGTNLDNILLKDKKWVHKRIGGSPIVDKYVYFYTRLSHKIAKILLKYFGFIGGLPELAIGRSTYLLIKAAKRTKADLYIAHNLAALPAAVNAALKNKAVCGFDAEDFHRNEVSNHTSSLEFRLSSFIEDKYFPKLNYFTTASPLISQAYEKLYSKLSPKTILNVFPKQIIQVHPDAGVKLKLFWFSQSIGFERGLEDVIEAMGALSNPNVELHLLGSFTPTIKLAFEEYADKHGTDPSSLFFYQPISSSEIFSFATQFDIGLATEIGSPKNRDLCLTNKIFTYIHSGLAIIASDTSAQKELMTKFNQIGMIYKRTDKISLQNIFNMYLQNKDLLIKHKIEAKTCANNELNWDKEQYKFLDVINSVINTKV